MNRSRSPKHTEKPETNVNIRIRFDRTARARSRSHITVQSRYLIPRALPENEAKSEKKKKEKTNQTAEYTKAKRLSALLIRIYDVIICRRFYRNLSSLNKRSKSAKRIYCNNNSSSGGGAAQWKREINTTESGSIKEEKRQNEMKKKRNTSKKTCKLISYG